MRTKDAPVNLYARKIEEAAKKVTNAFPIKEKITPRFFIAERARCPAAWRVMPQNINPRIRAMASLHHAICKDINI